MLTHRMGCIKALFAAEENCKGTLEEEDRFHLPVKTSWHILMLLVLMSIISELHQAEPWWGTLAPDEFLSLPVPFAWLLFYAQPGLGCCLEPKASPGPFLSSPFCWWDSVPNLCQSLANEIEVAELQCC